MKKFFVYFVLVSIALLTFTSCSVKRVSDTSANTPSASNSDTASSPSTSPDPANNTASESAAPTESAGQETAAATEQPADDGVTLETIRQGALDAGFTVDDNMQDESMEPKAIKGFIINYQDESSASQIPVYEFANSSDALKYADEVNKEGYCLCIINGKLLGVTNSRYGIVSNDKEKALLETWFKSTMMIYEEPAPDPINTNKDFAGACSRIAAINKALDTLVNKSVLIYGKSIPADDPNKYFGFITFTMAQSSDMSSISNLCEDQTQMDGVVQFWEMFGCTDVKLKHDAANEYTMTGKRAGMDTSFIINALYSPDKDSLRILDKDGEMIADYFEFVPLGGDKYAVQTLYERAIVGYKDNKITSLVYSLKARTAGNEYNPDADSIYPDGAGLDDSWVSNAGADAYEQFITFDGSKLTISAVDFTGAKLKAEISVE